MIKKIYTLLFCVLCFASVSQAVATPASLELRVNGQAIETDASFFDAQEFEFLKDQFSSSGEDNTPPPEFFYILESASSGNGLVIVNDHSQWIIGWWYRSHLEEWSQGDRLRIFFESGFFNFNNVKIENVDKGSTVWGVLETNPSKISTIKDFPGQNGNQVKLSNRWTFQAKKEGVFSSISWQKGDYVYIIHETPKTYRLLNINREQILNGVIAVSSGIQEPLSMDLEDVLHLEEKLNLRVLAQKSATKAVADSFVNYAAGLNRPEAPIGVFLFIGPTGVGKTELAKALTDEVFKEREALIRFDMSHFVDEYGLTRLIGSPPGYVNHDEGGQLTEALKQKPQSVVLFDEIEKAHPKIRKAFLPVFDEGYMVDASNESVSFRDAVIIMTSNICAQEVVDLFRAGYSHEAVLEFIEPVLMAELSPELYNRVEPVLFHPLDPEVMGGLVDLAINALIDRVYNSKEMILVVDQTVKDFLIQNGYHPTLGARPLQKLVDKTVVPALAYAIISDNIPAGSFLYLSYNKEKDSWLVDWEMN